MSENKSGRPITSRGFLEIGAAGTAGIRFTNVVIERDQQTKHKYSVPLSTNTLYKKLGINFQGFN